MLERNRRGYAVMTKELDAYSFDDESLEKCKRYCYNGDVVVEQIPYVYGLSIRIRFYKPYRWIRYDRFCSQFNIGWLHIQWIKEYSHKCGKVVYRSEDGKD